MEKTFSVIIPLYNKGPYVVRAITSVLQQTYDNFEIIIVNDGSTDDGPQKVLAVNDPRINLVSQQNSGVSAARNRGAEEAGGKYLAFLDADDTWEQGFLQNILELINEYPNAGLFGTSNNFIYPNGKIISEDFSRLFREKKTGIIKDYFGLFAEIHKSPFSNSNVSIPKDIYNEFGGYKVGVKLTEDSDLWCRIALKYPVAFNVLPLANYFLAIQGSTHTVFEEDDFEVAKTLQSALDAGDIKPDLQKSVKKLITFQKVSAVKRALMVGKKKFVAKKLFNAKIITFYPKEFLICFGSLLVPNKIFNKIRNVKH